MWGSGYSAKRALQETKKKNKDLKKTVDSVYAVQYKSK